MRNFRIDEASERQPQVLVVNSEKVRLYFGHEEVEREGMDGQPYTVYVAKFVELPVSLGTDALTLAKAAVIAEIEEYDKSESINQFTLNGLPMWLDDATRTKLSKRFDTDEEDGKTVTKLIYENKPYILPISAARGMLHQIESYATACFDKTNEHIATVGAKRSVDKVLEYDYTDGYPEEKPSFTIEMQEAE